MPNPIIKACNLSSSNFIYINISNRINNNGIQRYEIYSDLPNLFNDFVNQIYSPKNEPAIQYKTKFAFHKLPVSNSREY